jgi:MFS family permease
MSNAAYRWVIVAAGGLMGCIAIGGMFSLPVFLQPMSQSTGWSRTGISSAMTLGFLAMGFASFGWGALLDRFGPRLVVLGGTILLCLSLALASRSRTLVEFQIIYGVFVGGAAGSIFAPMMATVTGWFETQRSLAVSLVSAGMGMAPMTVSPFAAWLISSHDWRTSQLVIAIVALTLMTPAALLVRSPPTPAKAVEQMDAAPGAAGRQLTAMDALRSPQLLILALTNFFCCATHSGPIFHTVSYAIACGLPTLAAVSIYSVEGLAGLGGRVVFGLLGDRFGAKPVLVAGLLVQAFGAGAYFYARELSEFYAVATVFGLAYAGVMPLYAVIARENFPLRMMGTIIGATAMAGSLGMALGPAAGGWIYDTYANYGWLYLGSFGIGLGAALIALTLKPAMREAGAQAPQAALQQPNCYCADPALRTHSLPSRASN